MKPSIGRTVIVRNHFCGSSDDAPATITRVLDDGNLNLQVLPDCWAPTIKINVPLFDDEVAAAVHLAQYPGHTPIVAFWPARG